MCFCYCKASSTVVHWLFGAGEASSGMLSKHIALLLWDVGLSAWEETRHRCYGHKAQGSALPIWKLVMNPGFGSSITQFLDLKRTLYLHCERTRERRCCHSSIAWNLLPGITCKPCQLQLHWWCSHPPSRQCPGGPLHSFGLLPSSLQHTEGQWGVSAGHLLPVTSGGTDMCLLTQAGHSHPMAFWPPEAKRLSVNLSYLPLSYPFFSFDPTSISSFLWFLVNRLFRWLSNIATENWKVKNKTGKQSRMFSTTCPEYCITVIGDQILQINCLCGEERFSLAI